MQNGNQIAKKKSERKIDIKRALRPRLKKRPRIAGRDDAENEGVQAAPGS